MPTPVPPDGRGPTPRPTRRGSTGAGRGRRSLGRSPLADGARAGLGRVSWVAIVAIGTVVAALSVTRMQVYAVHANERDAVQLLRQLGPALEPTDAAPAATLAGVAERLPHGIEGSSWSDDGARLRRHGYLFELVPAADGPRLRAWPSEHSLTGRAAFQWTTREGLLGHKNPGGRWSGPEAPPDALEGAEWMPLRGRLR